MDHKPLIIKHNDNILIGSIYFILLLYNVLRNYKICMMIKSETNEMVYLLHIILSPHSSYIIYTLSLFFLLPHLFFSLSQEIP